MVHHTSQVEKERLKTGSVAKTLAIAMVTCALSLLASEQAKATPIEKFAIESALSPELQKAQIKKWCDESRAEMKKLRWKIDPCDGTGGAITWRVGGASVQGRPLIFAEFGNPTSPNTTLILSMVHGDEITPLYVGLQLAHYLKANPKEHANSHVVIAPMVNPDSFFRKPKTRTNARGVDVNRNFATVDWPNTALKAWQVKHRKDPRRFPGSAPRTEPETLFQEELIRQIKPQKILSVHSPLNHLDYDGPSAISLQQFPQDYVQECLKLRRKLKAVHSGFFPGSLGNYAGRELGIPTLTLELPTADPRKAEQYWRQFSKGMRTMIEFVMPEYSLEHPPARRPVSGIKLTGADKES